MRVLRVFIGLPKSKTQIARVRYEGKCVRRGGASGRAGKSEALAQSAAEKEAPRMQGMAGRMNRGKRKASRTTQPGRRRKHSAHSRGSAKAERYFASFE